MSHSQSRQATGNAGVDVEEVTPSPCFEWLLSHDRRSTDPALVLIALQDGVESVPDTRARFTRTEAVEDTPYDHCSVDREMLNYLGSWESPMSQRTYFVNPSYRYREKYSDIAVECGCGARMSTHHPISGHTDDCSTEQRNRARDRLTEKRIQAFRTMLLLGNSVEDAGYRLGIRQPRHFMSRVGIQPKALHEQFFERRNNTIVRLLKRHDTSTVAQVFDVCTATIRKAALSAGPGCRAMKVYREGKL